MKKIGLLLLLFCPLGQMWAQDSDQNAIVIQARAMADLMLAKNYTEYVNYVYPGIVAMAGSKEKLVAATKEAMDQMQAGGAAITKISFGMPGNIVVADSEWQTTIPQQLEVKHNGKTFISEYSLIAISNNSGKNWVFIETSGKNLATLRKSFPNLSTELVVPDRKQRTE